MTKIYHHKALLFFIIAAFLVAQWSSAHVHVAAHHHFDGTHHHVCQGHLHNFGSHHTDVIDASDFDSHAYVVELGYECWSPTWKKLDDSPGLLVQHYRYLVRDSRYEHGYLPTYVSSGSSWLSYSTVRLRAPPQFAS